MWSNNLRKLLILKKSPEFDVDMWIMKTNPVLPTNQGVVGSIPASRANQNYGLAS